MALRPSVRLLLGILALVCFVLAAAGVASRVNLIALGLSFWVTASLVP